MWSGGVEPRTFSGGCHHTLPLMNETIRDSPATHSHPVESISFSEDVPIEFDCNNDEHGIDKNVNFKTISDFKRAHQNNFVFIHVNVNSFRHKFAHLQEILSQHRVDYFAISESKIDDSFPDAQFAVQGYNIFRQDNTSSSGGLIIYVRSDIPHRRLVNAECNNDGIESLCIELTIGKTKTVFSCVYKHPKVKHVVFKESICQMADHLLQSYSDLVFLGDMNSCPTKSPVISELCDIYGLHNLIDQPTCFKGTIPSLIDVILVTNRKKYSGVLNCNCCVSDVHNFIGAATRRFAPLRKPRHVFYRSYRNFNDADFCHAVSSAPFHVSDIFDDVEDMAWFTSSLISTIINEHAPMKRKYIRQESVPYMNARLRKAMYSRNMARTKFRKHGKQYWHENRRQRNLVVSLRKQSLRKYFSEKCVKKDANFWKTISPFMTNKNSRNGNNIILRENDKTVVDSNEVCEIFNSYFANIASSIGFEDGIVDVDAAIQKHSRHPSVIKIKEHLSKPSPFTFCPVSQENISRKLKSIDIKKATGYDNIPGKILRLAHKELTTPLTSLINSCMSRNIFPVNMKLAEVSPSYKKSDNLVKGNYRPVSILTTLSKLYESTMNDQLFDHFISIFDKLLSAFRKGHSCQTLLVKCIEDWKAALDQNKHIGVLFTDLSKAFDCLPHSLLLAKLRAYGIDISACNLIASYLSNRKQRVKIGNARSEWISLSKGVPQGSILGPLLFNVFINDMFLFINKCTLYNYADDNSLSCAATTVQEVISSLQFDGSRVIQWFTDNGMQANPSKFQFMIISPDDDCAQRLVLNGNTVLVSEKHVQVLGVIIDSKLNFSLHVSSICTKAARQLNALARISNYLDESARKIIYNSFVASNFNYCPLVWHFCGATNSSKIEKIQERCLRIIYKDYESSYHRLLGMANTTTLVISRLRILIFEVFKSIRQLNPKCISDLFEVKSLGYSLRNHVKVLQPKRRTTTYGLRTVSYTGAKLWNDLFPLLCDVEEIGVFKSSLAILREDILDPTFTYI